MSDEPLEPLTLYSSWRGLAVSIFSPLLLTVIGVASMVWAGRVALVATVIAVLGVGLGAVALFDLPRRCVVSETGLARRCPLRSNVLAWETVTAITRAPGSRLVGHKRDGAGRMSRSLGGLTAVVGRRRYLLVDHLEGPDEYKALGERVGAWAPAVALSASPPPDGTAPTWIYHERRTDP